MNEILAANLRYYAQLCGFVSLGGSFVVLALAWLHSRPTLYPCQDCGAWNPVGSRCTECAAVRAEAEALGQVAAWTAAKLEAQTAGYRAGHWRSHVLLAIYQANYQRNGHPAAAERRSA